MSVSSEQVLTQRRRALDRANEVRLARAWLHREVRSLPFSEGAMELADAVEQMPRELAGVQVFDVLCWPRRMYRRRVERMLFRRHIGAWRLVGELTDRQRQLIAVWLREQANGSDRDRDDQRASS